MFEPHTWGGVYITEKEILLPTQASQEFGMYQRSPEVTSADGALNVTFIKGQAGRLEECSHL